MMDRDQELESFFESARSTPPAVSEALMARVLADASAAQPQRKGWRTVWAAFGGLPALGGLVTATCVGFWLGVAPPTGMPDLGGSMLGVEATYEEDLDSPGLTGFGWDLDEG